METFYHIQRYGTKVIDQKRITKIIQKMESNIISRINNIEGRLNNIEGKVQVYEKLT